MSINYTPDNTFIFSFVRMNPPTPGHLLLIKTMIDTAINLGVNKAYIITSRSFDGKNPLPCGENAIPKPKTKADLALFNEMRSNLTYKSLILNEMIRAYKQELINETSDFDRRQSISNLNIIVICSIGIPFTFIHNIIETDFIEKGIPKINMFFIVGRDRADFLDTIVDNFKTRDYINSINGEILERSGMTELKNTGMGSRSISEINPSEYSASFVRNLVKNNQKDDFIQVYSKYLSPDNIDKLYDAIKMGTRLKAPPSRPEDENPHSVYYDGKRLPVMGQVIGGKRRRNRSKKNRKTKRRTYKKYTRRYK